MKPPPFLAGDPLRAYAALGVLLGHVAGYQELRLGHTDPPELHDQANLALAATTYCATAGLFLFFVVSGYLVGGPFVRSYLVGAPLPSVSSYLRHRVLRIVPAFWVVTTVAIAYFGVRGSSVDEVVALYGFAQLLNWGGVSFIMGQGWSLNVEVLFYALAPLAAATLIAFGRPHGPRARAGTLVVLLVGAWAILFALHGTFMGHRGGPLVPHLAAFIPGVLLAVAECRGAFTSRVAGSGLVSGLLVAAGVAVWLPRMILLERSDNGANTILPMAIGAGLVLAGVMLRERGGGTQWRAFDNGPMRWAGLRSYSIYLWHVPTMYAFVPVAMGIDASRPIRTVVLLALVLPTTLALSWLSYRFVEAPFLKLKRSPRAAAERREMVEADLAALRPQT